MNRFKKSFSPLLKSVFCTSESQSYNLYLKGTTVSSDHFKMLASGECSLSKIMILYIQKTCGILILKGGSVNNSI